MGDQRLHVYLWVGFYILFWPVLLGGVWLLITFLRWAIKATDPKTPALPVPEWKITWADYPPGQEHTVPPVNGKHSPTSSDEHVQP